MFSNLWIDITGYIIWENSSRTKLSRDNFVVSNLWIDTTGYNMENYITSYKKTKTTQSLQNNDLVECFVTILDMIDEILILSSN